MNCEKESIDNFSKNSPFYNMITGCYTLKFTKEHTTMLANFEKDSTFKIVIPGSTGREYFCGKWFLSDSIVLIDVIETGGRDCVSGDVFESHDTANLILVKWKLNEIKEDGFNCFYKKSKFRKKFDIIALKTDECKELLSQ
jgi:hypothetical protein